MQLPRAEKASAGAPRRPAHEIVRAQQDESIIPIIPHIPPIIPLAFQPYRHMTCIFQTQVWFISGLGVVTVQRIWAAHGLAPHRWRTFKLSRDPAFVEKLRDVVGLYVAPPDHAVVLSIDEKSQIQPSTAPSPACR